MLGLHSQNEERVGLENSHLLNTSVKDKNRALNNKIDYQVI